MTNVYLNQKLTDLERRKLIFEGNIFLFSGLKSCAAICDYAWQIVQENFEATPETLFLKIPVVEFVKRAEATKNKFTNILHAKELLRDYAVEMGTNPGDYFFDVPRIRIVPTYDYLHAGVSYAYAAHRDTWYGGPTYQINHWMPVRAITPERTMSILPAYFHKPVKNSSKEFDLTRWITSERKKATENIGAEDRVHPLPIERMDESNEIRFAGSAGDIMVFSGTHVHASVPNHTKVTRFSVDFRFFHVDDVAGNGVVRPPVNLDSEATSTDYGMSSCYRLSDFSPFRKVMDTAMA